MNDQPLLDEVEDFHNILAAAAEMDVSDIHIKANAPVIFRKGGELVEVSCPWATEPWIRRVLQEVAPESALQKLMNEKEADFAIASRAGGRFRANVFMQRGTHVLALRTVKEKVQSFEELNLPPLMKSFAGKQEGLILLSGPTGAGKSTSLATMVDHINRSSRRHIITLEDPIEYLFTDRQSIIEQREVGIDTLSFHAGLRNVLRQDPDVIVIGEMRDAETFQIAIRAASTGHLVISSLHGLNAPQSLMRLLEFFPGNEHEQVKRQISAVLLAIFCQRLISDKEGALIPVLEILINTPTVASIIEGDRLDSLSTALETGGDSGMQTFNGALHALFKAGRITAEEALLHSPNPGALKRNMSGMVISGENQRIIGGGSRGR